MVFEARILVSELTFYFYLRILCENVILTSVLWCCMYLLGSLLLIQSGSKYSLTHKSLVSVTRMFATL